MKRKVNWVDVGDPHPKKEYTWIPVQGNEVKGRRYTWVPIGDGDDVEKEMKVEVEKDDGIVEAKANDTQR